MSPWVIFESSLKTNQSQMFSPYIDFSCSFAVAGLCASILDLRFRGLSVLGIEQKILNIKWAKLWLLWEKNHRSMRTVQISEACEMLANQ